MRTAATRLVAAGAAGLAALTLAACGATGSLVGVHGPPTPVSDVAPVTSANAGQIAQRVFTAAALAASEQGPGAWTEEHAAYTGSALTAAVADSRLTKVQPQIQGDAPAIAPQRPDVLAVSQGWDFPRVMVAKTALGTGSLPVLHLLVSRDAAAPFRIAASATMLPDATVHRFAPLAQGSPLVRDAKGLPVAPDELLSAYAASLAYPAPAGRAAPYAPDRFASQIHAAATAQAAAVSTVATFTQTHAVVPGSVLAVRQAAGGALVFGVIERTDTFTVKKGQTLRAPSTFTTLVHGQPKLTHKASLTTLEFVVFSIPPGRGAARLVAASEHLVSAAGS